MADSKGIRAGKAYVELSSDDSKLAKNLKQAEARLKKWGASIRSVGTVLGAAGMGVLTPMLHASKKFAEDGAALWEMSQQTGATVETLSALKYAGDDLGVSAETIGMAFVKMTKTVYSAANGSKSATAALGALGLSIGNLDGLNPDEQFLAIADALAQVENPQIRLGMAMDIFGKNAASVIPLLAQGRDGLEQYMAKAKDMGRVMSGEDAQAAHELHDAMKHLNGGMMNLYKSIGAALAPALTQIFEGITNVALCVKNWINDNKELVITIAQWAAVLTGAGIALVSVGYAISGVGAVLGVLASAITGIISVVTFLLNPLTLVIGAIAAFTGYVLYASGALKGLMGMLGDMGSDIGTTFKGIMNAMLSGNWALASEILWAGIKVVWSRGVLEVTKIWYGLKNNFGTILESLGPVLMSIGEKIVNMFAEIAVAAGQAFKNGITNYLEISTIKLSTQKAIDEANRSYAEGEMNLAQHEGIITGLKRAQEADISKITGAGTGGLGAKLSNLWDQKTNRNDSQNRDILNKELELWNNMDDLESVVNQASDLNKKTAATPDVKKELDSRFSGLSDLLDSTYKQTVGVKGTFSTSAIQGLAAGGMEDRIAKATEETASNTRDMLDMQTSFS